MRISSLETFPVGLPFREPYVTATGTLERREMVLLRIESDDGLVGWGDAVPLSLRGGAGLGAVRADLDEGCRSEVVGSTLPAEGGVEAALGPVLDPCAAAGIAAPALAAVEAALLDLLGKLRGDPVWKLLGAVSAGPVECNGTLGAGAPEEVAATARALSGAGFATLKVKVGTGPDRERMQAVREAVGPAVRLRVDANGAWSAEQATEALRAMSEDVGLQLAEQPSPTLEELAAVRAGATIPIVADESVTDLADAERASVLDACDAVTVKLAKVGGPRAALRIGARIPAYLSSALDSPLGIAAAVHTAQALPGDGFVADLAHGLATSSLFADNVADAAGLTGPTLEPAAAPGLGVEIDEAALDRLAIR